MAARIAALPRSSPDACPQVPTLIAAEFVFAQILRNWLLLHAVGVDASVFDATAVLIAVVTLGQLPVGPSVGAAAAVLILGSDGSPQPPQRGCS